MGRKNELKTPRSRVKHALRQLWLRSRERQFAISRDSYTCQYCKQRQSRAKGKEFYIEVHHMAGIANWETVIDAVYEHILCHPDGLETLCRDCHDREHKE